MKKIARILISLALTLLLLAGIGWGGWLWYDSHTDRSGWSMENGVRTYRDFHGNMVTGWQQIEGARYYFTEDGQLHTGWLTLEEGTYYLTEDLGMATGKQQIKGQTHFFSKDGTVLSGWQEFDGKRYFLNEQGVPHTGRTDLPEGIRYFDEEGALLTGWMQQGNDWYYLLSDGSAATGWQEIDGKRYSFDEQGVMRTGWIREGEYSYYLTEDGSAAVSPTQIDGKTYYFSPSGIHIWLVNPWNFIHEDYEPELVDAEAGYRVDASCHDALMQMLADCRAAGYLPAILSGYRSHWDQQALFRAQYELYGASASMSVAYPGTSEHQLGLAVDLVASHYKTLDMHQASTAVQQWLMAHCWEYGFILRYPDGSTEITGIIYEPWHYRYVGVEVAMELKESGLTLEEYLGAVHTDDP